MRILSGKPIMEQIVAGRLCFYRRPEPQPQQISTDGWRQELERFHRARELSIGELIALHRRALCQVGEAVASIFSIHSLLLEDADYVETVQSMILNQGITAEHAVQLAEVSFASTFSAMDDPYMRAREADIQDISQRVLRALMGRRQALDMDGPAILVADRFLPSEVMELDQHRLLGLIARRGTLDSHTAVLVRAYHIPAIVEVDLSPSWEGHPAVMDGHSGRIYLDPDQAQLDRLRELYQDRGMPLARC